LKKILTLILTIILGVSAVGCNLTSKEVKIISGNSLDGISISKLIKEENEIKKGYKTSFTILSFLIYYLICYIFFSYEVHY
jgi:NitT/TauT family transport system substrate-binding protein